MGMGVFAVCELTIDDIATDTKNIKTKNDLFITSIIIPLDCEGIVNVCVDKTSNVLNTHCHPCTSRCPLPEL